MLGSYSQLQSQLVPVPVPTDKRQRIEDQTTTTTTTMLGGKLAPPPHTCPCDWFITEQNRFQEELKVIGNLPNSDDRSQLLDAAIKAHTARVVSSAITNFCALCYPKWGREMKEYCILVQGEGELNLKNVVRRDASAQQ